jgi:hypothetical protein
VGEVEGWEEVKDALSRGTVLADKHESPTLD